jgi:hypothetical protein
LLTDLDASCRYCGQLLRGLDAGDTWSTPLEGGVRVEADVDDLVARPTAVVRRAGGEIHTSTGGESNRHPIVADSFRERSQVTRQHYSIQGQEDPRDFRRMPMLVVSVALVAAIALALFVRSRGDDPHPAALPEQVSWDRVGPPLAPFTAELPGEATPSQVRPFDEIATASFESSTASGQTFLVGAFELPAGALAFGPDAYMKATAERIAARRGATFVDGSGSDVAGGHVFDGTLTAPTGWGLVHLAIHSSRLYYVAAFVPAGTDGAQPTYERIVQSLVPA